jgi:hypothetical protein
MRYDGFGHAILSSLRHVMTQDSLADFRAIANQPRDVMLVWGRQDSVLPFSQSDAVRAALPAARFLAIDDAGHLPHTEQTDQVAAAVLAFLGETGSGLHVDPSRSNAAPGEIATTPRRHEPRHATHDCQVAMNRHPRRLLTSRLVTAMSPRSACTRPMPPSCLC